MNHKELVRGNCILKNPLIMKLLYINTYIPYPLNSGGSQAFFTITDYIRKHHELSLLLYVHNSTERRNVEKLRKLWPDVTFYTYEKTAADEDSSLADFSGMSWRDKTLCRMLNYFHASFGRKINRRRHKSMTKRCFADTDESAISKPDFVRDHAMLFMKTDDLTPGFLPEVTPGAIKPLELLYSMQVL